MRNIAVLGGGSWATAIVKILCKGSEDVKVNWWMRSKEEVEHIKKYKHNRSYLSDVEIDLNIVTPFSDLRAAIKKVDTIFIVVPAAFVADAIDPLSEKDFKGKLIVSASKGMIPNTKLLPTEYLEREYGVNKKDLSVIVGPCHAEEVALERQSYLTIGSENLLNGEKIAELLRCRFVKCNVIDDVVGSEYCAVMKNIAAISCGIAHGLGYGDNFQSVLVCNALQEIKEFLKAIDDRKRDFSSSAYLGDILVTSYSQFSRNRTFGNMIGRGYSVIFAQMEMSMVAEGYYAAKSIMKLRRKHDVNMPITEAVYRILYEKNSPRLEFSLLTNNLK